jgi:hypothetical protein
MMGGIEGPRAVQLIMGFTAPLMTCHSAEVPPDV